MTETEALVKETEGERVVRYRAGQLIKAGYSTDHATQIGARTDIDLHYAIELVEAGCTPDIAARIVL